MTQNFSLLNSQMSKRIETKFGISILQPRIALKVIILILKARGRKLRQQLYYHKNNI